MILLAYCESAWGIWFGIICCLYCAKRIVTNVMASSGPSLDGRQLLLRRLNFRHLLFNRQLVWARAREICCCISIRFALGKILTKEFM